MIYGSYYCPAIGCDWCFSPQSLSTRMRKMLNMVWGLDSLLHVQVRRILWASRPQAKLQACNKSLGTINVSLHKRQREEIEFALYTCSSEYEERTCFFFSHEFLSIKRICQIRRVSWLDVSYRMVFWFFFLQHEFFFFFFITCFFPVVLLDFLLIQCRLWCTSISTIEWKLKRRGYFIFWCLHQGIYFFFDFSLQISLIFLFISWFREPIFDRFL